MQSINDIQTNSMETVIVDIFYGHDRASQPRLISRRIIKLAVSAFIIFSVSAGPSKAQTSGEVEIYATGALGEKRDDIEKRPSLPLARNFLPDLVDLSSRFPPVGKQGQLGSCVSWAVAYAARSYYGAGDGKKSLSSSDIPSPAYMHGIIRSPSSTDSLCEGGARITDAFALLKNEGVASLAQMSYSDQKCHAPPETLRRQVRERQSFGIEHFNYIYDFVEPRRVLDKFKSELARGHPVVLSVKTDRAFHKLRGRSVWQGTQTDDLIGGHAVTLVGYSEKGQYFKFINSWGSDWGDRGYGRLSYDSVLHRPYGFSMRIAGVVPKPIPPPTPQPAPIPVDTITLPEVSCGRLAVNKQDGRPVITGFVREPADLEKVRAAAAPHDASLEIDLRPWPQCEALMTLVEPLKEAAKPTIGLVDSQYRSGETLSFSVDMAPFEGFLHVAYVQADGNVVNLVQQGATNLNTISQSEKLHFGDGKEGRSKFTISGPFGPEMVIAIASASPLFPEPRPTVEIERDFLTALRKAILARPDPEAAERRISATFAVLTTEDGQK